MSQRSSVVLFALVASEATEVVVQALVGRATRNPV